MPSKPNLEAEYSEEETARRRDEVVRRMANTPPQPNGKPKPRPKRKRPAASDQAARKSRTKP